MKTLSKVEYYLLLSAIVICGVGIVILLVWILILQKQAKNIVKKNNTYSDAADNFKEHMNQKGKPLKYLSEGITIPAKEFKTLETDSDEC